MLCVAALEQLDDASCRRLDEYRLFMVDEKEHRLGAPLTTSAHPNGRRVAVHFPNS
jgi:hypothetical protein